MTSDLSIMWREFTINDGGRDLFPIYFLLKINIIGLRKVPCQNPMDDYLGSMDKWEERK